MKCFEQESVSDEKFPKLSARVAQFKTEEKEVQKVCSLITDYAKDKMKESVIAMIEDGVSDEKIVLYSNFTIEEVQAIRAELSKSE